LTQCDDCQSTQVFEKFTVYQDATGRSHS
jgi:hypothetical protein